MLQMPAQPILHLRRVLSLLHELTYHLFAYPSSGKLHLFQHIRQVQGLRKGDIQSVEDGPEFELRFWWLGD